METLSWVLDIVYNRRTCRFVEHKGFLGSLQCFVAIVPTVSIPNLITRSDFSTESSYVRSHTRYSMAQVGHLTARYLSP